MSDRDELITLRVHYSAKVDPVSTCVEKDCARTPLPSLPLPPVVQRILGSANIWIPVAAAAAFYVQFGVRAPRSVGLVGHKLSRWRWSAGAMGAGIGGVVFLKLEARRLFNEVADDPSLRTIARQSFVYHEMNRTPGFRKSVIRFAKMSSGVYQILRNADIRLPEPYEPIGLTERIAWWSHRVWSLPTSRMVARQYDGLHIFLHGTGVSPHDIDICTTFFANAFDYGRWDYVTAGSGILFACGLFASIALENRPRLRWWVRLGRGASLVVYLASYSLRPYLHWSHLQSLHNRDHLVRMLEAKAEMVDFEDPILAAFCGHRDSR